MFLDHEAENTSSGSVDELETEQDKRNQRLSKQDPVYTVSLKDYTMSQLNSCEQLLGTALFQNLMDTVDCEIVDQLKQFMR